MKNMTSFVKSEAILMQPKRVYFVNTSWASQVTEAEPKLMLVIAVNHWDIFKSGENVIG